MFDGIKTCHNVRVLPVVENQNIAACYRLWQNENNSQCVKLTVVWFVKSSLREKSPNTELFLVRILIISRIIKVWAERVAWHELNLE